MTRKPLSELPSWQLIDQQQDIRGWPLFDERGNNLGTIAELIVDTDTEYVEALRLHDGTEVAADGMEILTDSVLLHRATATRDSTTIADDRDEIRVPVVEEQLEIGKRQVRQGGIRVQTHIVERPVEEQVTLRDETVHVDRRRVDRPATDADFDAMDNQSFEVRETDEEAIVNKRARVTEEVRISKEAEERTETVRGTERRTDVDVEKLNERERGR